MLLVSHDRVFLDNIVTSTLAFDGQGGVTEYVGGYEDFLRHTEVGIRDRGLRRRRSAAERREGGEPGSALPRRSSRVCRDEEPFISEARDAGATDERRAGEAKAGQTDRGNDRACRAQASQPRSRGETGKLSFKEKKEFESLPAHIEALEAEQARLQNESASTRVLQGERRAH